MSRRTVSIIPRQAAVLALASLALLGAADGGNAVDFDVCEATATNFKGCSTPDLFQIRVLEVAACTSATCSEKVTLGSSAATFNIASVSSNAVVGAFAPAGLQVPTGTYTHAQLILSRDVAFRGRFTVAAQGVDCLSKSNAALLQDGQYEGQEAATGTGTPQSSTAYYSDTKIAEVRTLGFYSDIRGIDGQRMAITIAFSAPVTITESTRSFALRGNVNIKNRFSGFYNLLASNGPNGCHVGVTDPAITVSVTTQ